MDIPHELLQTPLPFVAIAGLNPSKEPAHKAIWEFIAEKDANHPAVISAKLISPNHAFPKRNEKRSNDSYVPDRVIKPTWLHKHRGVIPAVLAVFVELEWEDAQWGAREIEIASKLGTLRSSLYGRGTRVALILIQRTSQGPLSTSPDVAPPLSALAEERCVSLRKACGFTDPKAPLLTVCVAETNEMKTGLVRVERAVADVAQVYYREEARRFKKHRDVLNKLSQQLLFARYYFKVAFFAEIRGDAKAALKYYHSAYSYLKDVRDREARSRDIKQVAGWIDYKICRFLFASSSTQLEAIEQFRRHCAFYRRLIGPDEIEFQHYAWLSRQYRQFADIFDSAIRRGTASGDQTHHPGFYYRTAAEYAATRRDKVLSMGIVPTVLSARRSGDATALSALAVPSATQQGGTDAASSKWRTEYSGIARPRASHPLDDATNGGTSYLDDPKVALEAERNVDHSALVVDLLTNARAHFKKHNSGRMTLLIAVKIAEEYASSGDCGRALQLFDRIARDYRKEKWWAVLAAILSNALTCAFTEGNVRLYVAAALEYIAPFNETPKDNLIRVQHNLMRVLMGNAPLPEPEAVPTRDSAVKNWSDAMTGPPLEISLGDLVPFVDCKVQFESNTFTADSPIRLRIFVRCACPLPIRFSHLAATFGIATYNTMCHLTDSGPLDPASDPDDARQEGNEGLRFDPGQTRVYNFEFKADEKGDRNLECVALALHLGSGPNGSRAVLKWDIVERVRRAVQQQSAQTLMFSAQRIQSNPKSGDWAEIIERPLTRILPRTALLDLSLEHTAPALVGEFFYIGITLCSRESTALSDVRFSVEIVSRRESGHGAMSGQLFLSPTQLKPATWRLQDIPVSVLAPGQPVTVPIYVRCAQDVGNRMIHVKASYMTLVGGSQMQCVREATTRIPFLVPFDVTTTLSTAATHEQIVTETAPVVAMAALPSPGGAVAADSAEVDAGETLVLLAETKCTSQSASLEIVRTELILAGPFRKLEVDATPQVANVAVEPSDAVSECHAVAVPDVPMPGTQLGTFVIHWRRTKGTPGIDPSTTFKTELQLPSVAVESAPFSVVSRVPAYGRVNTIVPVMYTIRNNTAQVQDLELAMEPSDAFMFSGFKSTRIRILPRSSRSVPYNLFPLGPGLSQLPTLRIRARRYEHEVPRRRKPSHIYILTEDAISAAGSN
eukprot:Opistho-2@47332